MIVHNASTMNKLNDRIDYVITLVIPRELPLKNIRRQNRTHYDKNNVAIKIESGKDPDHVYLITGK